MPTKLTKKVKSQALTANKNKQILASLMSRMKVSKAPSPRSRPRNMTNTPMGDAAARYAAALVYPFSKEAEGVRVPEPYAIATVARKVHTPMVLTSTAAGGVDFSVQPHLYNSFVQTLGSASGSAGVLTQGQAPAGFVVRSAVTRTALAALAQSYRIVAIGVRIKTNIDFTRSGGRIYGAILPASQELPLNFWSNATLSSALACYEIPNDGTSITPNIINLPRSFQFSVSELMSEGGVEIHFPICSARALDFLDGQNQDSEQGYVTTTALNVINSATGAGQLCAAGHSQFVMRGEGLQPSADVLTIETIYHVEVIPLVGSSTTLVEAMPHTPAPVSPTEIHMAHTFASLQPVVAYVSQKMRDVHNGGGKRSGIAGRIGQLAGAAERVLGIAARGLA